MDTQNTRHPVPCTNGCKPHNTSNAPINAKTKGGAGVPKNNFIIWYFSFQNFILRRACSSMELKIVFLCAFLHLTCGVLHPPSFRCHVAMSQVCWCSAPPQRIATSQVSFANPPPPPALCISVWSPAPQVTGGKLTNLGQQVGGGGGVQRGQTCLGQRWRGLMSCTLFTCSFPSLLLGALHLLLRLPLLSSFGRSLPGAETNGTRAVHKIGCNVVLMLSSGSHGPLFSYKIAKQQPTAVTPAVFLAPWGCNLCVKKWGRA